MFPLPITCGVLLSILAAAAVENDPTARETPSRPPSARASTDRDSAAAAAIREKTSAILQRVRNHSFQPINRGFTIDARLRRQGVADLSNTDGRVRLLAIRDLVRLGTPAAGALADRLQDENEHVRQLCALTLGLLRATKARPALEAVLRSDGDPVVRSQAAVSLGQLGEQDALAVLHDCGNSDSSRDVRHQCEVAAYRIQQQVETSDEVAKAFAALDEDSFRQIEVGKPAAEFALVDTNGRTWRLADHRGKTVVLVWIFADWCPVCHGEFHELIELRDEFTSQDIELVTIECHDRFRARHDRRRVAAELLVLEDAAAGRLSRQHLVAPFVGSGRRRGSDVRSRTDGLRRPFRMDQPAVDHRHRSGWHRTLRVLWHLLGRPAVHSTDAGNGDHRSVRVSASQAA